MRRATTCGSPRYYKLIPRVWVSARHQHARLPISLRIMSVLGCKIAMIHALQLGKRCAWKVEIVVRFRPRQVYWGRKSGRLIRMCNLSSVAEVIRAWRGLWMAHSLSCQSLWCGWSSLPGSRGGIGVDRAYSVEIRFACRVRRHGSIQVEAKL